MMASRFDPHPELETARFRLTRIRQHHKDIIYALRSDLMVTKYISRDAYTREEQAQEFIQNVSRGIMLGKNLYWILEQKSDDKPIGSLCLWNFTEDGQQAEVGYDLLAECHRQGIMTEAFPAIVSYAFEHLGVSRLEAFIHPENAGSIGLVEHFGFAFVRTHEKGDSIYQLQHAIWQDGK